MLPRHALSDADWERIKDLLPGRPGQSGWTAKDNRQFLDAIRWIAKTGAPWRDLPERFGNWNSVWKRFGRWCRKGTWQQIFKVEFHSRRDSKADRQESNRASHTWLSVVVLCRTA